MCGFWISVGLGEDLTRIAPILRRGPDHTGTYQKLTPSGPLFMAHTRLMISDLSPASHQPFIAAQPATALVWNGALYNYQEHRQHLQQTNHPLHTTGDTEVLSILLSRNGIEGLAHEDGMFSLAFYDQTKQKLLLARDRFGEKPLFYASGHRNGRPWFSAGSDIKQFLNIPGFQLSLNRDAAAHFIDFGHTDSTSHTFVNEIKRMPPGAYIELDLSSETTLSREIAQTPRTWVNKRPPPIMPLSAEDASEMVRDYLTLSVKRRLVSSDVPYGACLSGGLDSSLIVALMASTASSAPVCFSAVFDDEDDDPAISERVYVQAMQKRFGLEVVEVHPTGRDITDKLEHIIEAQGEPFAHTSICAQWFVFEAAHARNIKVILDGQGADELFGGYTPMLGMWLKDTLLHEGPVKWRQAITQLCADGAMLKPQDLVKDTYRALIPENLRRQLLTPLGKWPPKGLLAQGAPPPPQSARNFTELCERLVEQASLPPLLRYEDRNSMDHAVETRLPFLSPELADLSAWLPYHLKVRNGWRKAVLRDVAQAYLPEEITNRRVKLGFATPQSRWMKGDLGKRCDTFIQDLSQNWVLDGFLQAGTPDRLLPEDKRFRLACFLRWADMMNIRT